MAAILLLWTLGAIGWANAQAIKFKHVVVILQENRTPDNIFGSNPHFEPGVDLATEGLTSTGKMVPLTPIPWQHVSISITAIMPSSLLTTAARWMEPIRTHRNLPRDAWFRRFRNISTSTTPTGRFSLISISPSSTGGEPQFSDNQGPVFQRTNSLSPARRRRIPTANCLCREIPSKSRPVVRPRPTIP